MFNELNNFQINIYKTIVSCVSPELFSQKDASFVVSKLSTKSEINSIKVLFDGHCIGEIYQKNRTNQEKWNVRLFSTKIGGIEEDETAYSSKRKAISSLVICYFINSRKTKA